MSDTRWQERYTDKCSSPGEALSRIRNGQTIFIGSGCAEPRVLTEVLAKLAYRFSDIRIINLLAIGEQPFARPELTASFRCNTFFIGRGVESGRSEGVADYIPINMSELPGAIRDGLIDLDVALVQVSEPDDEGKCSLGISVDIARTAIETAELVIAQVNENMPVTYGNTNLSVEDIDYLVEETVPLVEVKPPRPDPFSFTIGRHIAGLISDGMTLHFDQSLISAATMRYLTGKRNLGIHTDILTDGIFRLIRSGAVTNERKCIDRGKTVATMALGTSELYDHIGSDPSIELHPIEYVNDPVVISKNREMVSVLNVQEVELSGLAKVEFKSLSAMRGLPGSTDFIDGTRRSPGGLVIMALYSTTFAGKRSRIVPESAGRGMYFSRVKVDMVVTEYGYVSLRGLSIQERAIALISIAHPRFRKQLFEEAKRYNYISENMYIPPDPGCIYPHQYSFSRTFYGRYSPRRKPIDTVSKEGGGSHSAYEDYSLGEIERELTVFFRPVKPSDARGLQRMYYSLSDEVVRMRYHGSVKTFSSEEVQKMANIDFSQDVAIVGLVGPKSNPRIVAEGRYMYNPGNNMGEFDILVSEGVQGRGVGTYLADYLKKIAYSRGLSGVYAEVIPDNAATMALLHKAWPTAEKHFDSGICIFNLHFPPEDVKRPKDSIIIYSGSFDYFSYGPDHPFKPKRAGSAVRLITRENMMSEPWMRVEEPKRIAKERLFESHDPDFIDALERANSGEWDSSFLKYGLGGDEVPIFPGLFDYVLLYTSATLTGADLITDENANIVFNPLGGFHHAERNLAGGFCYVNDAIAAIDAFLAKGFKVAYIDIDAHHGNGVQKAYYSDDRVLTVSLHETGKTLYPWSGFEDEIGEELGKGFNINIPLPPGTDDEAFVMIFDDVVTTAVSSFRPNVVVAVVGADTHKNDPLTHLNMTNNGMMEAMERIRTFSNHLLILGGGGYDVRATTRAWCRVWAAANRIDAMPEYLTVLGGTFLGSEDLQGADIIDMTFRLTGPEKSKIIDELERIAAFHSKNTLPRIEAYCRMRKEGK